MSEQPALAFIKSVEIYSKPNCFFCVRAKEILSDLGIPFVEKHCDSRVGDPNFAVGAKNREELVRRAPNAPRQYPQIFINDQRVGGLDGLRAAMSQLGITLP